MKLLSINHGLITTTSPPSSLVSPVSTPTHSIPISVPKTHITNLNSNTSLSLTLFQYFILHAYKQVSHKSSSPPNTFIIMYDLLENIENINTSSLSTHIPHFTKLKSPSFFIPKINPTTNTYELYISHNYQHNQLSSSSGNNNNKTKHTSTQSFNIIFAKNCNTDKTRLQQTHMFIMKQIEKLYEICYNCSSTGSNSCGIMINKSGNVVNSKGNLNSNNKKELPLYMVNYPNKCSEYESGLLCLKICISSIKSINVGWYLNTMIHTKIDSGYMEGIKTKFINELKQQIHIDTIDSNSNISITPKNGMMSPMIYNRKINLAKPVTNLIRKDVKLNINTSGNSTYKKKIIHRCSSGEHSFVKTLSDISTIKEFTNNQNTNTNANTPLHNININTSNLHTNPSNFNYINNAFNCNSTLNKISKNHREFISQYTNHNTTAVTTEIDSYNNITESKQSRNKCNSVKIRKKHPLEHYAYLLAHKPSFVHNVSSCSGGDNSVNAINFSKYTSDVIEFTEDEDKNDTLEEFNLELNGKKRKGISKIPKPKLRESVILYKGGNRHPSYENKMRGTTCLGDGMKCGENIKNECIVF